MTADQQNRRGTTIREALLVTHTGKPANTEHARTVARELHAAGFVVRVLADESDAIGLRGTVPVPADASAAAGVEIVFALGGDGTLLRGAELARPVGAPLLGINLGKIGFLAEAELSDLDRVVRHVVERTYSVDERMTVDVVATYGDRVLAESWALNEVTVEKGDRARMLEVMLTVEERALSRYGCDGMVVATPTGSTAYAMSAGGPVVWPDVEALVVCPISAHALFSRPLVVTPEATIGIAVEPYTTSAVLCCDGRRVWVLLPGSLVQVRRGKKPVRVVRLRPGAFTDRLVAKFELPVNGWRAPLS